MECNFFGLGCPVYKLRIASWNINGVTNKMERDNVISWTDDKDIIFLNKTKTSILFNVPGFYVYQDESTGRKRDGTALLLKKYPQDTGGCLPDIEIGGCYIPPPDSPYFDESSFVKLQEHCMDSKTQSIVIGDLNARCGKAVCLLEKSDCNYSQQALLDPLIRPQSNGNSILQLCKDTGMLILNNLIYRGDTRRFKSKLTYRKGQEFILELDLCLDNYEALPLLESLRVSEEQLPSDHLPVCITIDASKCGTYDMEELLKSAKGLGHHADLNNQVKHNMCKKSTNI